MKKIILVVSGIVLALVIFVPTFYYYKKYQSLKNSTVGTDKSDKNQVNDLVSKIGKLYELPEGEEPTIATVSDKSKLPPQAFFAKAKNGDQVLIYTKAKKAILYRPSANKIIEIGPVSINTPSPTAASPYTNPSGDSISPTAASQIRVAIYNASKSLGLAASTEAKLKSKFKNITVVEKSNSKGDYAKTLVAEVRGGIKGVASDIADFLGGEVESLPPTEAKPDADILVIVVD